jgi:hypothetical protein
MRLVKNLREKTYLSSFLLFSLSEVSRESEFTVRDVSPGGGLTPPPPGAVLPLAFG